jgi:NADP-dependent aldehyde dehydrogenase
MNPTILNSVDAVMKRSKIAFQHYKNIDSATRALFLDTIANEMEALGDELLETAHHETNLPIVRFQGERARTCNQLRAFASHIREGSWVNAIIETAEPNRAPLPKPDMRKIDVPIGPIVVFGASNFPLAYSTAGGDTVSALAAGCSVVVKSHPAHPKTAKLVSHAIYKAIRISGVPEDTFMMVDGDSFEWGQALVQHEDTCGVGFTGSLVGGRAIFDYGQQRKKPIPVFAEMGSTNPVILMPSKLQNNRETLVKMLALSVTMGVGQFCTNPGIILGLKGPDLDGFAEELGKAISEMGNFAMLHEGIKRNYVAGISKATSAEGVKTIYHAGNLSDLLAPPVVCTVDSKTFYDNPELHHEVFGPFTMIVSCDNMQDLTKNWKLLEGQLTTTFMCSEEDYPLVQDVINHATDIAGRIVFNNAPTGVDVNNATVHGGPYPASTDNRFTSVGMEAIKRWIKPICFQDTPQKFLPLALQDKNSLDIWRRINAVFTKKDVE